MIETVKDFFNGLVDTLRGWKASLIEWWNTLDRKQMIAAVAGVGVMVGAWITGGMIFQAAVGAFIINGLLWLMIYDIPYVQKVMAKHGKKIDLFLTVGGIFFGPGTGVLMWLSGAMIGVFFTTFRHLLMPHGAEAVSKETANA